MMYVFYDVMYDIHIFTYVYHTYVNIYIYFYVLSAVYNRFVKKCFFVINTVYVKCDV